ncbi:hypothetical protein [Streptomyces griseomycini]|uniref:Allene oxide cyclase barrel-like domain-containing protein n=1 Tax=Streptomyces griseomycini TaxID=66895 RepID=A0A7W7M032_9ACTN|nr:hypothetical protein [Streptomyces griseomycini]MBB4899212.1 hypothetical protein [Streptomyces griseomycini]
MKHMMRITTALAVLIPAIFFGATAKAQGGERDPRVNEAVKKSAVAEVMYQATVCEQPQEPVSGSFETEINLYGAEEGVTDNDVEILLLSTNPLFDAGSFHIATGGKATVSGGVTTENPWTIPDVPFDDWDVAYDQGTGQVQAQLVKASDSSLIAWPVDLISDCLPAGVQVPEGDQVLQNKIAEGAIMEGTLTDEKGDLHIEGGFYNASGSVAFEMKVTY